MLFAAKHGWNQRLSYEVKSERKRQIRTISHWCNLKYATNELIYEAETESQTQKTDLWLPKVEAGCGRDKLGVWDQQIHTTIYKIDKQQGPTVQHRELQSILCSKP